MYRFKISLIILTVMLSGLLSLKPYSVSAAVMEVKIKMETGTIYTIPGFNLDTDGIVTPILADNFYVKNSSGNQVQMLDMEVKASLYAVSIAAANIRQRNYWKIRKDAENAFKALLTEVDKVREDVFSPAQSGTAIVINSGASCATAALYAGIVGTAAGPVGTAVGAGSGCVTGAIAGAAYTLADEVADTVLEALITYSSRSRESVVLEEGIFLLEQVWVLSSEIDNEAIRWLNNGQVLDFKEISYMLDMEISSYIYTDGMWNFFSSMYPESTIINQASQSRVKTIVGYSANAIEALDGLNLGYGHLPMSTITELLFYVMNVVDQDQSPTEAAQAFKANLEDNSDRRKDFRRALMSVSPLSSENISANKAYFESKEPVEYSGSYLITGEVLFDVGEEIVVKSTLQKLGTAYQSGSVEYEVLDNHGNSLTKNTSSFTSDGYYSSIQAIDNPGDYTIFIKAKDSTGSDIGSSQLRYTINNPAEGHDLSINNLTLSRTSVQPSQTVNISFSIMNNGMYLENATTRLYVFGQDGYSWSGAETILGSIPVGQTSSYNNILSWAVPSSLADGSYTAKIVVLGEIGDITPIDNMKEQFVYVGDYNVVTPTSMIGKEFEMAYDSDLELQSECDYPYSGAGGYGFTTYSRSGKSYAIAIGGLSKTADRLLGKVCLVVRNGSPTGALLYSSNGIDERVGEPIYINGTPLIIYASMLDDDHMNVVVGESYSGIGFDVRERTSIPSLETEYNSKVGNISCTEGHTYIHKATSNSNDQWDFNLFWNENAAINYRMGACDSSGRQVFLSSSEVKKHYFVVEHQSSSQPSNYIPSISGASKVSSKTFYWLTGILDVKDYVDEALTISDIADSYISGDSNVLKVNVIKQGTLTPETLDVVWNISGENNYQIQIVKDGMEGLNSLEWDTNGLPPGNYQISAKVQAPGDLDTNDIEISKTINILPPLPTEVEQNVSSVITGKAGQRYPLTVSLKDSLGTCRQDGSVYAKQIDASGKPISLAILTKDSLACVFSGNLILAEGATSTKVTGHLNRLDNGLLDIPASITNNIAPVAAIKHNYPNLTFTSYQTIVLESDSVDSDGDNVANYIWEVSSPSGLDTPTYGETSCSIGLAESGTYLVKHFVIDGLGKQSNIATIEVNVDPSGSNVLIGDIDTNGVVDLSDTIFALRVVSNLSSGNSQLSLNADVNGDNKIGIEEAIYALNKVSEIDQDSATLWFKDADGDGYSDRMTQSSVSRPDFTYYSESELIGSDLDCDDNKSSVYPGATEICNDNIDNNCDDTIDEGCPPDVEIVYEDDANHIYISNISFGAAACQYLEIGSFTVPQGEEWTQIKFAASQGDIILLADDGKMPSLDSSNAAFQCVNGYSQKFDSDEEYDWYNGTQIFTWETNLLPGDTLRLAIFSYGGNVNNFSINTKVNVRGAAD